MPKANYRAVIIPKGTIDPQDTNIIEIPMDMDTRKVTVIAKSARDWNPNESNTVIAKAAKDMIFSECAAAISQQDVGESNHKETPPSCQTPVPPPPSAISSSGPCGGGGGGVVSKPKERESKSCGTPRREHHHHRHHHHQSNRKSPRITQLRTQTAQTQTSAATNGGGNNSAPPKSVTSTTSVLSSSSEPHSPYCPICSASSKIFKDSQMPSSCCPLMNNLLSTPSYFAPQQRSPMPQTCPLLSMRAVCPPMPPPPPPPPQCPAFMSMGGGYGGYPGFGGSYPQPPPPPIAPPMPQVGRSLGYPAPSLYSMPPRDFDSTNESRQQDIDKIIGEKIDNIFKPLLKTLAETRSRQNTERYCSNVNNNNNRSGRPSSSSSRGKPSARISNRGSFFDMKDSVDAFNTAFISDDDLSSSDDDDLDYESFKRGMAKSSSSSMSVCTNAKCDRQKDSSGGGVKFTK